MQSQDLKTSNLDGRSNATWSDECCTVDLTSLALTCAMSVDELKELMDYGVMLPVRGRQGVPQFAMSSVEPLRSANQLRLDYDLDLFVVVLLVEQFQRIEQLETEVRSLKRTSASH
jgi:chaperone modulatory protein CbpM